MSPWVLLMELLFDESIFVEVKLNGTYRLLCTCMYRRGESSEENNEKLLDNLQQISNLNYSHLLIMGDFNLTEIDWENCSSTNKNPTNINFQFAERTKDCYLYQHITECTRQRGSDNPSTLDLIFSNEEDMVSDIKIEAPLGKSDHSIIYFTFNCTTETSPPEIKTIYQKGDYEKMKNILSQYTTGKISSDKVMTSTNNGNYLKIYFWMRKTSVSPEN